MSAEAMICDELNKMNTKFYPNRVVISFEKEGTLCSFVYREFWDYIPLDIANEITELNLIKEEFLKRVIQNEYLQGLIFSPLEKGIEIRGKSECERAITWLISEGLIFAFTNQSEINAKLDSMKKPIMTDDSLKIRAWNTETDKIVRAKLNELERNLEKKGVNIKNLKHDK